MRGSVLAGILAVLLLPLAAAFPQDAVFTDSVWIEFGEPEAGQGLAFTNPPETSRAVEVAGRACQAIVHENDQHRLHFRVDPGFNIAGRDTISVVVEYLDNGRADMGIRYTGASGMLPSDPVRRGRSDEWKTARWQLTDPLFGQPDGGGIEFAIHASGWSGTADLHVASVRVTHEAVKLSVEPRIFAGDGASHTPVAVEVYQANGVAAPDGTEVAVSCNDAVVPQTVVTQNGRAELNLTHGTETATLRVTAQYGDASDTALIYQVAGEGELVEFTQALDPAYIRENLVYAGREAESITVVQDVDPNDPDVVEVRLTFPEGLEKNRALLVMDEPPLPGKPNTLRMELGSDGTLFELNVLMGDAGDEAFLYQAFSDRGGLDGEHSAAMDVDRIGYREGGDSLIDLPVNWAMLSLHFVPGTTEGVLYIRKVEADCIGTIASAANATGPVTAYRTEPVIIEGVAPIGSDQGEYCRQISALQSALEAIGCAADYDDLMVASGAAFSIAWRPGAYVYHVCEACPDDVVVAGALATGASAERIECQNADGLRVRWPS